MLNYLALRENRFQGPIKGPDLEESGVIINPNGDIVWDDGQETNLKVDNEGILKRNDGEYIGRIEKNGSIVDYLGWPTGYRAIVDLDPVSMFFNLDSR